MSWWSFQEVIPAMERIWTLIGQFRRENVCMLFVLLTSPMPENLVKTLVIQGYAFCSRRWTQPSSRAPADPMAVQLTWWLTRGITSTR